jgi:putative oxidoreductase
MALGLLVVRLAVGLLMMGHGAQKLFGSFGGHGPDGTGQFFESMGLSPGRQMALAAGASELVGGALLALGFLTPLAATMITAVMLTAAWTAHRASGLWVSEGGYEYNLVLIAGLFALTAVGPGEWSLDNAFGIDANGGGWAFAELGAAVLGTIAMIALGRSSVGRGVAEPVAAGGGGVAAGPTPLDEPLVAEPDAPDVPAAATPAAAAGAPLAGSGPTAFVVWLEARPGREAEAARFFEQEVFLDRDFFPRAGGRQTNPSDRVAAVLRGDGGGLFAEPRIERAPDRPL